MDCLTYLVWIVAVLSHYVRSRCNRSVHYVHDQGKDRYRVDSRKKCKNKMLVEILTIPSQEELVRLKNPNLESITDTIGRDIVLRN
jgi:hypothetical protein